MIDLNMLEPRLLINRVLALGRRVFEKEELHSNGIRNHTFSHKRICNFLSFQSQIQCGNRK